MTNLHTSAAVLTLMTIEGCGIMQNKGPIKVLDTVHGSNFLKIESAMKILKRPSLDLSHFTVLLVHHGKDEFIILSEKPNRPATGRNFGVRHGATSEMSAQDLSAVISDLGRATMLEKVQGGNLRAIQEAEKIFLSRSPNTDLTQYNIEVVRDGDSLLVIFADKDRQPGTRGNIVGRPGLEVELAPDDLRVRRSNFIR